LGGNRNKVADDGCPLAKKPGIARLVASELGRLPSSRRTSPIVGHAGSIPGWLTPLKPFLLDRLGRIRREWSADPTLAIAVLQPFDVQLIGWCEVHQHEVAPASGRRIECDVDSAERKFVPDCSITREGSADAKPEVRPRL
jgi:hypothetical protein